MEVIREEPGPRHPAWPQKDDLPSTLSVSHLVSRRGDGESSAACGVVVSLLVSLHLKELQQCCTYPCSKWHTQPFGTVQRWLGRTSPQRKWFLVILGTFLQ